MRSARPNSRARHELGHGKIVRGAEVDGSKGEAGPRGHGVWAYSVPRYPLACGYSRQPLLDACRQLKSLYGLTGERTGLFREGWGTPDISCSIEAGAATTVKEPSNGAVRFGKYVPFSHADVLRKGPAGTQGQIPRETRLSTQETNAAQALKHAPAVDLVTPELT